jgi:acyl carrier protein
VTSGEMHAQLKTLVSQVLGIEPDRIDDSLGTHSCEQWTSMKHLMLVTKIESRFKVRLTNEDVVSLTTYGAIGRKLSERLSISSQAG